MYSNELFEKAKSDKVISDARIKMLDNLTNTDLINISTLIRKTKNVGYQEKIIDDLVKYIIEN